MAWSTLIDIVRGAIFVLAHWCGGSVGSAIFVASVGTRLALFPLTLGATRRRLVRERDAVKTPDPSAVLDSALSAAPAIMLYSAIRAVSSKAGGFLWIRNLASSDRTLALIAAAVAAATAWGASATPAGRTTPLLAPVVISAAVTFLFLSHMSAGLAIYSVANSLISALERAVAVKTIAPVRT